MGKFLQTSDTAWLNMDQVTGVNAYPVGSEYGVNVYLGATLVPVTRAGMFATLAEAEAKVQRILEEVGVVDPADIT